MLNNSNARLRALRSASAGIALAAAMLAVPAFAQDAAEEEEAKDSDIVVTGTLIRGAVVTGSQTITVGAQRIEELGVATTQQLLASVPQFGSFNQIPTTDPRSNALISFGRINLRGIPGFNKGSGSVTLTLMNGHRIAPVGIAEASIDPDSIPSAIVERMDVVLDGGSSLYGADAVSGVVNFVTKKKFDGLRLDGTFGFGTELTKYKQYNGSITAGKSWTNGGAYISVGYDASTDVKNGDTSWARSGLWSATGDFLPQGTQCLTPVGTQSTYVYADIPGVFTGWSNNPGLGGVPSIGVGTKCDDFLGESYFPKSRRYNVFASVYQELTDTIEFRMTGSYANKKVTYSDYPIGMTTRAAAPPTGAPGTPGAPASSPVTIDAGTAFSFGVHPSYQQRLSFNAYSTWNISPELAITLGEWQVRAVANYGESKKRFRNPGVDLTLAQSLIDTGVFTASTVTSLSPTQLNSILNREDASDTRHKQLGMRVTADGPLFALPGGDAKLAVGVEYQNNKASNRFNTGTIGAIDPLPFRSASINAKSVFGELSLPVFSMLDVSASLRYDNYSNFGNTTNPTLGAKFKPFEWLSFYGHWGKSFNAPTALDLLAVTSANYIAGGGLQCTVASPCVNYANLANPATAGGVVLLTGSSNSLKPQTSTQWTIGFDVKPTSRFNFGMAYYNIKLKNLLGSINPANPQVFSVSNPDSYAFGNGNTTVATSHPLYQAIINASNGSTTIAAINNNGLGIGQIVDFRVSNVNDVFVTGLDFHLNYAHPSDIGDFVFGVTGNKSLQTHSTKGPFVDYIQDGLVGSGPTFNLSASLGWSLNKWSAKVTLNHSAEYLTRDYAGVGTNVDQFNIVNLFVGYKFLGDGPLSKSSLRLTVDNLFNRTPQIIKENSPGPLSYRAWTLGRVVKIGATFDY